MAIGILEVFLVNAKGLRDSDFLGNMDPYVIMQYRGQERKSSVASDRGGCPVWNETLKFRAEFPGQDTDYKLTLKIMDKDTFTRDDFVGEATIHLRDLLSLGVENGTSELHPAKYSVVNAENSYCGEIQVGITFTLTRDDDSHAHEFGGWKESDF